MAFIMTHQIVSAAIESKYKWLTGDLLIQIQFKYKFIQFLPPQQQKLKVSSFFFLGI